MHAPALSRPRSIASTRVTLVSLVSYSHAYAHARHKHMVGSSDSSAPKTFRGNSEVRESPRSSE